MQMQLPGRQIEKQNWAELLLFLYSQEEKWENFGRGDPPLIDSDHPLVERTSLSKSEVKASLSFLEEHDLIKEGNTGFFQLTEKGFNVAHEREMKERELRNNSLIVLLTVVLAVGALSQVLIGIQSVGLSTRWLVLSGAILLIIGYTVGQVDHR